MDAKELARLINEKAKEALKDNDEMFVYAVIGGRLGDGELHTVSVSHGKGVAGVDFLTYILSDLSETATKLSRYKTVVVGEGEEVLKEEPNGNPS